MAFSAPDHLECPRCAATYVATVLQGLCRVEGSPLLARYDLARVSTDPVRPWRPVTEEWFEVATLKEPYRIEGTKTMGLEGMFLCPEGAATVTAARHLARTGWLSPDDEVVLLNTGAGVLEL